MPEVRCSKCNQVIVGPGNWLSFRNFDALSYFATHGVCQDCQDAMHRGVINSNGTNNSSD